METSLVLDFLSALFSADLMRKNTLRFPISVAVESRAVIHVSRTDQLTKCQLNVLGPALRTESGLPTPRATPPSLDYRHLFLPTVTFSDPLTVGQ